MQQVVDQHLPFEGHIRVLLESNHILKKHVVAGSVDIVDRIQDAVRRVTRLIELEILIHGVYAHRIVVDRHCVVLAN